MTVGGRAVHVTLRLSRIPPRVPAALHRPRAPFPCRHPHRIPRRPPTRRSPNGPLSPRQPLNFRAPRRPLSAPQSTCSTAPPTLARPYRPPTSCQDIDGLTDRALFRNKAFFKDAMPKRTAPSNLMIASSIWAVLAPDLEPSLAATP